MGCRGLHCHGCGDGGGGALIAVLVVLAIIGAIVHAIWHEVVEAVEIVALVLLSAAGLAVLAGGIYLAVRIRARVLDASRTRRTVPMPARVVRLGDVTHGSINADVPGMGRPAIEAPRWPLAGQWDQIKPSNERESNS